MHLPIRYMFHMAALLALAAAGACDAARPEAPRLARAAATCEARPGGSRWAGEYARATASYGRDGDRWLHEVAGVVVRDTLVYVYDAPEARIVVLTDDLRPIRSFGREGDGPGELFSLLDRGMRGENWRWMGVDGDGIMVFDGVRIHRFGEGGEVLDRQFGAAARTPALSPATDRIASFGGGLVAAQDGYDVGFGNSKPGRYEWRLVHRTHRSERTMVELQLAPLPLVRNGVPFVGPEQARPLWDLSGDCVAVTDGTGDWLLRARADGGAADTLPLDLPRITPPEHSIAEIERLMGPGARYRGPSAPRRVSGLVVDPDGYAWLLLRQDRAEGVEVLRVSLATGAAEHDTVPAFPDAFGPPGIFYAATSDRKSGEAVVERYTAAAPEPRPTARAAPASRGARPPRR